MHWIVTLSSNVKSITASLNNHACQVFFEHDKAYER